MRAAIYVRISKDPEGLRAGVERQLADCQRECERRGWEAVVFEDNDVSAYSGKRRPGYEAMLAAVKAGEVGAIVAWAPDRLTRQLKELEGLVDLVEATGCKIVTVQGGEVNLATPEGRVHARMLGTVARYESEKLSSRSQRQKLEEAKAGLPHQGPHRPWGFEDDRVTHRPEEVAAIRDAAARILNGESLASVSRRVGLAPGTVKSALRRPRMVGVRVHRGVEHPAVWAPILDRDTWTAVRAVLDGRRTPAAEPGGSRARRSLLAGFARCALCGGAVSGGRANGQETYQCYTCKRVGRLVGPVDDYVRDWVLGHADLAVTAPGVDPALPAAVRGFEIRLAEAAELWKSGVLATAEYAATKVDLDARLAAAREALLVAQAESEGWLNVEHLERGRGYAEGRAWWDQADLRQKRALLAKHVERVLIGQVGGRPVEDTVTVE